VEANAREEVRKLFQDPQTPGDDNAG